MSQDSVVSPSQKNTSTLDTTMGEFGRAFRRQFDGAIINVASQSTMEGRGSAEVVGEEIYVACSGG